MNAIQQGVAHVLLGQALPPHIPLWTTEGQFPLGAAVSLADVIARTQQRSIGEAPWIEERSIIQAIQPGNERGILCACYTEGCLSGLLFALAHAKTPQQEIEERTLKRLAYQLQEAFGAQLLTAMINAHLGYGGSANRTFVRLVLLFSDYLQKRFVAALLENSETIIRMQGAHAWGAVLASLPQSLRIKQEVLRLSSSPLVRAATLLARPYCGLKAQKKKTLQQIQEAAAALLPTERGLLSMTNGVDFAYEHRCALMNMSPMSVSNLAERVQHLYDKPAFVLDDLRHPRAQLVHHFLLEDSDGNGDASGSAEEPADIICDAGRVDGVVFKHVARAILGLPKDERLCQKLALVVIKDRTGRLFQELWQLSVLLDDAANSDRGAELHGAFVNRIGDHALRLRARQSLQTWHDMRAIHCRAIRAASAQIAQMLPELSADWLDPKRLDTIVANALTSVGFLKKFVERICEEQPSARHVFQRAQTMSVDENFVCHL